MPASSSSAKDTKPKAKRKAKAASATRKSTTRKASAKKKAVEEDPSLFEDDFGDGVNDEPAPKKPKKKAAKKKPAARKPRAKKEPEPAEFSETVDRSAMDDTASVIEEARAARFDADDSDDFGDDRPAPAPRKSRRRPKATEADQSEPKARENSREESSDSTAATTSSADDSGSASSNVAASDGESGGRSSSSDGTSNKPSGDSEDERPRRRRRRRRRGGRGDSSDQQGPGNTQNSGSQNSGGQNSGNQGGGNHRGGGNSRGGDRNTRGGRGRGNQGGGQPQGGGRGRNDRGGRGSSTRRTRNVQASTEVIEGPFEGVLEMHPKGYGFLRDPKKNYAAEDSNPFVSGSVIEKYKLREGVLVKGEVGSGSRNQGPRLQDVELIDGYTPQEYEQIAHFDDLTPVNPHEQIKLEIGKQPITMRVMDLLCPIGKGQRALLVAPPRTGKTMLLQDIANSVTQNHPEVHLMVLLIDERPEEVTEMTRSVKGEVIASSLDHDVESHVRIAQLIIERGKRLAEEGQDVFILLDSITRLARAYNKWVNPSGRTGRGGLDIRALDIPKKLFGTARLFDEGGSLTVCGTALIETNNGMDEAIFQEFKGTGNMEMVLSRDLADRRIWPAIDIGSSGTRREEKILDPEIMEGVTMLRRSLIKFSPVEAMEQMTRMLMRFDTNDEFLKKITAML